jgi:hypothetical protein
MKDLYEAQIEKCAYKGRKNRLVASEFKTICRTPGINVGQFVQLAVKLTDRGK